MENTKNTLLRIFAVIAVLLIIYNIITGATVQKIGIPGLFEVEFDTSNVTSIFQANKEPKAQIKDLWTEHNIIKNDVMGMIIHVKFDIDNFKDNRGEAIAFFFDNTQAPLRDTNSKYSTSDGQVAAGNTFKPDYVNTVYEDFQIFLPYSELEVGSGQHILKLVVVIRDDQDSTELARSGWDSFTITNP